MFQHDKAERYGVGATPTFFDGRPFYVRMDVFPTRSEDRSSQIRRLGNKELGKISPYKDHLGIDLLIKLSEDQDWLIQEQATQIKELQNQLADYEQELYQKENRSLTTNQANYAESSR